MNDDMLKQEDLSFFVSGASFILGSIYFEIGRRKDIATYDLYVRDLPECRNYLVFAGLNSIVNYLLNFKFTDEQIEFMKKSYNFSPKVINYYKNFRFSGDVEAMPEGSISFANEPVIRITAPIIEAQMIERYLINTVMVNTVLASKLSRFVHAAGGKKTGINFTRSQGVQAALIGLRAAKMVGVEVAALPYASLKYGFRPENGSVTHAFVTSFSSEEEALRTYCQYCNNKGMWLSDSYNITRGIKTFARVVSELKKQNKPYPPILNIDSGNLTKESKFVRRVLDSSGLQDIQILLMANLNEYKVDKMQKEKAKADIYSGGTELMTSPDAPKLEVVYKMAQLTKGKKNIPTMKLSVNKLSLPGKKQVYRIIEDRKYQYDVIGLENEKIDNCEKLLKPIIRKGKLITKMPNLEDINKHYLSGIKKFDKSLLEINKKITYPVKISNTLRKLAEDTKEKIEKVHNV